MASSLLSLLLLWAQRGGASPRLERRDRRVERSASQCFQFRLDERLREILLKFFFWFLFVFVVGCFVGRAKVTRRCVNVWEACRARERVGKLGFFSLWRYLFVTCLDVRRCCRMWGILGGLFSLLFSWCVCNSPTEKSALAGPAGRVAKK